MAIKNHARTLRKGDTITNLRGEKYLVDVPFVEHTLGATHSYAIATKQITGERTLFPLATLAPSDGGGFRVVNVAGNTPATIDHPQYYGGDTTYEAIKVIEAWGLGFHLGNVVKYISRAGKKDQTKELEDLEKASWYLQRRIDQLKES